MQYWYKLAKAGLLPLPHQQNLTMQRRLTKFNRKNQILNDGYLGSHNDEERSEVR